MERKRIDTIEYENTRGWSVRIDLFQVGTHYQVNLTIAQRTTTRAFATVDQADAYIAQLQRA